jgi:hypothetical protein
MSAQYGVIALKRAPRTGAPLRAAIARSSSAGRTRPSTIFTLSAFSSVALVGSRTQISTVRGPDIREGKKRCSSAAESLNRPTGNLVKSVRVRREGFKAGLHRFGRLKVLHSFDPPPRLTLLCAQRTCVYGPPIMRSTTHEARSKTSMAGRTGHRSASSYLTGHHRHCAASLSSIPLTYQFMLRI